jgi:hypothetical protein
LTINTAGGCGRAPVQSSHGDAASHTPAAVKVRKTYFVIDGHHRTALARRSGAEMIDADLTELIARVPLPAGGGHARGRSPGA